MFFVPLLSIIAKWYTHSWAQAVMNVKDEEQKKMKAKNNKIMFVCTFQLNTKLISVPISIHSSTGVIRISSNFFFPWKFMNFMLSKKNGKH